MSKKELSIKIDYLSIIFDNLKAEELIRKVLGLPLDYFMIQKAKVKHKDYTNLYQFGTIKVYGDRQSKDGTSEAGCYLILSGQGCEDYYSFLQTSKHTYSDFFKICLQIVGRGNFQLTRIDIAIDHRNDIPFFTVAQIKRKFLKDESVSKSKSYRFAESSFDEDIEKTVYIGDGKSNISYRFYDTDKEQAGKYQLPYEEMENWKRTELQLLDEVAHSFAMLMCETLEELGNFINDNIAMYKNDI
ncbi:MAG: replication initiation factor domain-containing protein [Clostridium sp.]|uniref:replication initiation factor domain-containing protein n=1 Tax=Clostridium sp. TaxID=1506 RepID=UPI00303DA7DE